LKNLTDEELLVKIKNGEEYIIRLKSPGDAERKVKFKDFINSSIVIIITILIISCKI